VSRIKDAIMVNRLPGASWHPHRGVTAILRRALSSKTADVKFFSWAPVASITSNFDGTVAVDCGGRGTVTGRKIIVATNGYTRDLIPEVEKLYVQLVLPDAHNRLVPYRAQAARVVPPPTYAGTRALQTTYAVQNGPYLMQTPHSGIVFGPYVELDQGRNIYGIDDDSTTTKPYRDWLEKWCRENYAGWGDESTGEGLVKQWAGIICHSVDCLPLVGQVPGRPNVWIAAGYSGHGMAQIVNITRGLNQQFKTGEWDKQIPRCFEITETRLTRALERGVHPFDFDARNVTTGPLAHHMPEIKGHVARM
jgi:glycine/D-amino acid oxidase-like deaminating enzyme